MLMSIVISSHWDGFEGGEAGAGLAGPAVLAYISLGLLENPALVCSLNWVQASGGLEGRRR